MEKKSALARRSNTGDSIYYYVAGPIENLRSHMSGALRDTIRETSTQEFDRYHWGLIVGPKNETPSQVPGKRYHVRNTPTQGWKYEEAELHNVRTTNNLLARILIAKVEDHERLVAILRSIPIVQNDPNWRCRSWIANALAELAKDDKAVGTSQLNWAVVEMTARQYVARKTAAGRYQRAEDMLKPKPTWDMLENKETVA
ncbi:hypothetical protein Slin14017_G000810 [Septoria linicola]|nr:hypothetical protein Slin14017_G000810 [Septoria linicola]